MACNIGNIESRCMPRTRDDDMVKYIPQADQNEMANYKNHQQWILGDDSIIEAKLVDNTQGFQALALENQQNNIEIAPSAKKLWAVEEPKEDGNKGMFNPTELSWREAAWSTGHPVDHSVSQPISMVPRRSGSFPGEGVSNVLSPRSSETSGLGVKMVEYVLGTSPTTLDARLQRLALNPGIETEKEKVEKVHGAPSSFEPVKQELESPNPQANGIAIQNGLPEEDKAFNRTPGSRQPSPAEEDRSKVEEHLALVQDGGHEPVLMDPATMGSFQDYNMLAHGQQQMDSPNPNILPTMDNQLTRYSGGNSSQQASLQLLQQQQYMQSQQMGLPPPGAFPTPPYVINTQEPYVGTLIPAGAAAVLPQYYGLPAPWSVYPANIIQGAAGPPQGTATPQGNRRPLTPNSSTNNSDMQPQVSGSQPYVIPAYYDHNGPFVVGNVRGLGNGGPVRLVSPAPLTIVNPTATNPTGNNVRAMLGGQAQGLGNPSSLYNPNPSSANSQPQPPTSSNLGGQQGGFNSLGLQQNNSLGYGNNTLGTIGSPALAGLSSGLGGNSTGRRDSFDRSSAFSPSLDYRNNKWSQSYGALGIPSGNLTPPPSLGNSSTTLPLGLSGNRIISAAPGAEAKYRNIFATSIGSPFNKSRGATLAMQEKSPTRSRLLEDFRNNRYPNLQLRDLANHIVEFSRDQHGSRFIQQKLERASLPEKQLVFSEIMSSPYVLMTDVFGNYVIQKFFEFGVPEQKAQLVANIRGSVVTLATQMYGCRVIQKALESIGGEQQQELVRELDGHVLKCVKDQNGNHVVQKCVECVDPSALQFIIDAFRSQVYTLSTHPYGCRVIQRILEHCTVQQTTPILEEMHQNTEQLIQDQYGNYVVQHVLEHGNPEDKSKVVAVIRGKVLTLSQHKFASNVVEKCVAHGNRAERAMLIDEVVTYSDGPHSALMTMMKDQYANYVIQKMLDMSEVSQRKQLLHKIRPHMPALRKGTYGKHILAKLDKYFMKNTDLTMAPIGPPNGQPPM